MQMSSCCRRLGQNVREELWSYCALAGILLFNTSIVLLVYAYKRATPCPLLAEILGITLLVLGVLSTLASWYVHRQQRQKKRACFWPPCCSRCCRRKGGAVATVAQRSTHAPSSATSMRKAKFARGKGKLFGTRAMGVEGAAGRPFSTPEFRRYDEFVNQNTAGVESGMGEANHDSPSSSRSIYPGPTKTVPAFVNPRFKSDETSSAPQTPTAINKKATRSRVTVHMV